MKIRACPCSEDTRNLECGRGFYNLHSQRVFFNLGRRLSSWRWLICQGWEICALIFGPQLDLLLLRVNASFFIWNNRQLSCTMVRCRTNFGPLLGYTPSRESLEDIWESPKVRNPLVQVLPEVLQIVTKHLGGESKFFVIAPEYIRKFFCRMLIQPSRWYSGSWIA